MIPHLCVSELLQTREDIAQPVRGASTPIVPSPQRRCEVGSKVASAGRVSAALGGHRKETFGCRGGPLQKVTASRSQSRNAASENRWQRDGCLWELWECDRRDKNGNSGCCGRRCGCTESATCACGFVQHAVPVRDLLDGFQTDLRAKALARPPTRSSLALARTRSIAWVLSGGEKTCWCCNIMSKSGEGGAEEAGNAASAPPGVGAAPKAPGAGPLAFRAPPSRFPVSARPPWCCARARALPLPPPTLLAQPFCRPPASGTFSAKWKPIFGVFGAQALNAKRWEWAKHRAGRRVETWCGPSGPCNQVHVWSSSAGGFRARHSSRREMSHHVSRTFPSHCWRRG